MTSKIRILGVGSPFGDDRFGWAAAEALRDSPLMTRDSSGWIGISILDRPGALLPAHWQGADVVILLDAVRSGSAPGTRHGLDARAFPDAGVMCSSHGFGVASAIGLARALGNMPSRLLLRGVEADLSWPNPGLSPVVAETLPVFVRDIAKEALILSGFYVSAATNSV